MSGFVQGCVWLARLPDHLNNPACKAILARIADAVNDDGEGLRPLAKGWIAEDVGISADTAQRWLQKLKTIDLISTVGGGGRSKAPTYSINVNSLSEMIPDNRRPRGFRSGQNASEKKGGETAPLSNKRGADSPLKGCSQPDKGVHGRTPSTRTTNTTTARTSAAPQMGALDALAEATFNTIETSVHDGAAFLKSYWRHVHHVSKPPENAKGIKATLHVTSPIAVELMAKRLGPYGFDVLQHRENAA